jgi:hypothetical protein
MLKTFIASADLSTYQYHAVKLSAANTVALCGNNERAIGILQDKPAAAGAAALVCIGGTSKLVAGELIAVGKHITSKADGHGEVADAAGEWVFALALENSAADGEIIEVLMAFFTAHASDA